MRALLLLLAGVAVALTAALALPGGADRAAAAPAPVGCEQRAEPGLAAFDPARDTIRGPFAIVTTARDVARQPAAAFRPRRGRLGGAKLPVALRAGHRATLSVTPGQRASVALQARPATRAATTIRAADAAVTYTSCPAGTPAYGGGTVGPITGWAGAVIVSGPRCVRLELAIDGVPQPEIALPLGRPCRDEVGAPRTRTVGCGDRSMAGFPDLFARPGGSLVAGPVAFSGLRTAQATTPAHLERLGWWKSPLLLRVGEQATVSVEPADRDVARLAYAPDEDRGATGFGALAHTLRLVGCASAARAGSRAGARPVTFWSGGFVLRRPACVDLRVTPAGRPSLLRRVGFATRC
jgi:hypothetical protein